MFTCYCSYKKKCTLKRVTVSKVKLITRGAMQEDDPEREAEEAANAVERWLRA